MNSDKGSRRFRNGNNNRPAPNYQQRSSPRFQQQQAMTAGGRGSPMRSQTTSRSTSRSVSPHGRGGVGGFSPLQQYQSLPADPSAAATFDTANASWRSWRPPEESSPSISHSAANQSPAASSTASSSKGPGFVYNAGGGPPPTTPTARPLVPPPPQTGSMWTEDWDDNGTGQPDEDDDDWHTINDPKMFTILETSKNNRYLSIEDIVPSELFYKSSKSKKKTSPTFQSQQPPPPPRVPQQQQQQSLPPSRVLPKQQQPVVNKFESPFMYPQFLGDLSHDHYNQWGDFNDNHQKQRNQGAARPPRDNGIAKGSMQSSPARPEDVHPDDYNPNNRRTFFSPYLSAKELELQLSEGTLLRGVLRVNRRRRYDAYVTTDELDHDIYIGGERDRNRAFDGDVVAVRLTDPDLAWKRRKEIEQRRWAKLQQQQQADHDEAISDMDYYDVDEEDDEEDEEEDEDDEEDAKPKYAGQVVGILDRPTEPIFVGTVFTENNDTTRDNGNMAAAEYARKSPQFVFRPLDKRAPLFLIRNYPTDMLAQHGWTGNEEWLNKRLMVLKATRWPITLTRPIGQLLRVLGDVGDLRVENEAILADCGIKVEPYSKEALQALPPTPWQIPAGEIAKRRDLRSTRVFTIDPVTAKDLDDALHIKRLDDGNFEVGVHIADVSYFVKPHTPLDTEARERGSSTYLVDRVIPMLPKVLCEDVCSLNPGEDKLTFSIIWKMDPEGFVLNTWFGKTIIRSCAKLSYDDAQSVIWGQPLPYGVSITDHTAQEVEQDILDLAALARHKRRRRFENGALALQSIKLTFALDENGEPESVSVYESQEANQLVEEFMLQANISAAQKICSRFPNEALLRRHPGPILRRLNQFIERAAELGFKIDGETGGRLHKSFEQIEDGAVKDVLLALAIKPMQRAKYFCSGTLDMSKFVHYALNEPLYTHFTSPIRRYADILVHRQLQAALETNSKKTFSQKMVQRIAFQCNYWKERTRNAQDMSIHLYLARYLSKSAGASGMVVRTGVVMTVHMQAVDVYVPEYGLERRIHVEELPLERYEYESENAALTLYWKRGAVVNMETQLNRAYGGAGGRTRNRKRNHNGAQQQQQQNQYESNTYETSGPRERRRETIKIPRRILVPCTLDSVQARQSLSVFSTLDVGLQVNSERSPPYINLYPLNPFA